MSVSKLMYVVYFAAIDLVSTVVGDQSMHLGLVKEFVECGKLKQARRLVEVVIHLLRVNHYSLIQQLWGHVVLLFVH